MTRNDITAVLIDELGRIAPEIDASRLDPNAELREELDIDSMDFLNFVIAVTHRLGIDVPELDYRSSTRSTGRCAISQRSLQQTRDFCEFQIISFRKFFCPKISSARTLM